MLPRDACPDLFPLLQLLLPHYFLRNSLSTRNHLGCRIRLNYGIEDMSKKPPELFPHFKNIGFSGSNRNEE